MVIYRRSLRPAHLGNYFLLMGRADEVIREPNRIMTENSIRRPQTEIPNDMPDGHLRIR